MTEEQLIYLVDGICKSMENIGNRAKKKYDDIDSYSYTLGYVDGLKEAFKLIKEQLKEQ